MGNKYKHIAISSIIILIISYLDFITGYEVSFSIFYTIPIIIITWNLGIKAGVLFSLISAAMWFSMDYLTGHTYSHWSINYWGGVVELSFYLIITYLINKVKTLLEKEKEITKLNLDLISVISHEFNNLLTAIHISNILLKEGEKDKTADRIKFYSIIDQNYTMMREYIKMLLNKSRLESGKLKLNLSKVEIRKLVREVIGSLEPLILEKNLKLITDFPTNIIPVKCDPDITELVISNLISNAIKYSKNGGLVRISIERKNGEAEISVEDNGIGIKKEDIEKITGGFYRTEEGRKQAKGFGIGLRMVKEFLELHGSSLNIQSEEGKGSRFYFKLPIYKDEENNSK
ncbi:MAG: HAMP domain-containing histidine kinase [Elusimicrobiales bacterium]|nr:HAMP domain-containing histidine kinase [Elusimicrobiales bacterium]